MPKGQGQKTVKAVMHDYKQGTLHSGSKKGPIVQSRKQAVAIAMHEMKGNFEPKGNSNDGFNGLGTTLQDHNPDGPSQPAAIGTFSGSRSGWKRAE